MRTAVDSCQHRIRRQAVAGPDQAILDFVQAHRLAVMATQRRAGPPQLTMINYLFDGKDYLVTDRGQSVKAKHLRRRPELSMAIVDGRQQVIVNGTATLIEDLDEVVKIAAGLREHAGMPAQTPQEMRDWAVREERVIIVFSPESYFSNVVPA
jgi:PPOX class probable F420-dependent enzyme